MSNGNRNKHGKRKNEKENQQKKEQKRKSIIREIEMIIITALLPVLILLLYIYRKDNIQPEPVGQIVKAFLLGVLSIPFGEISCGEFGGTDGGRKCADQTNLFRFFQVFFSNLLQNSRNVAII